MKPYRRAQEKLNDRVCYGDGDEEDRERGDFQDLTRAFAKTLSRVAAAVDEAAAAAEELPPAPTERPQRPPPPANPLWGPRGGVAAETRGAAAAAPAAAAPAAAAPAAGPAEGVGMDTDPANDDGPATARSTRDEVGEAADDFAGLAPPSAERRRRRHARKSGRADDDGTQAGASQIRSPLRRTAADDIRSPPRHRRREDGFRRGDRVEVCDTAEIPPAIFRGTITYRDDDIYAVTLDNGDVWPCVDEDHIRPL